MSAVLIQLHGPPKICLNTPLYMFLSIEASILLCMFLSVELISILLYTCSFLYNQSLYSCVHVHFRRRLYTPVYVFISIEDSILLCTCSFPQTSLYFSVRWSFLQKFLCPSVYIHFRRRNTPYDSFHRTRLYTPLYIFLSIELVTILPCTCSFPQTLSLHSSACVPFRTPL